jgi:hypothetical protein
MFCSTDADQIDLRRSQSRRTSIESDIVGQTSNHASQNRDVLGQRWIGKDRNAQSVAT